MKVNRKILISFLLVGLVLAVVGCAQASTLPDTQSGTPNLSGNTPAGNPTTSETETPQAPEEENPKVLKIADILEKPENYQWQVVVVEGKIITECPSGCWFTLNDGTGTIYVDLKPSNLVIPQKRGAFARVYAQVVREGSDTYLIGTEVEF
jgi:glucose/arabinose dehydrogenase